MIPLDQKESMKMLIKNTLTLLCKNGLSFNEEFGVEALIGITVDKDEVFLVSMNEVVRKEMDITSDLALDQGVIPEEVDEGPMKKRPRVSDSAPILPVTVTTSELPSTSVQPSEEIFPEESLLGIMKEETEDEKEISDASVADDPAEDDLEYQSVAAPDDGESDFSTPVATPVTTRHRRSGRRSESSKTETVATSSEPLEELDGSDISETGEGASEKHKSREWDVSTAMNKRRPGPKGRRTRHETTLSKKIELIKDAIEVPRPTLKSLAKKYNIGITTVHDILRKKNEYLAMYDKESHAEKRRFTTDTRLDALDACVWSWHEQVRIKNSGQTVPDEIIRDNAMRIAENMGLRNFKAPPSWLENWKSAYLLEEAS